MFSFLGEFNYKFPEPIKLTKTMKDYLEDEVDEKYYINSEKADKLISDLIKNNELPGEKSTCVLKDMGESFGRYTDTAVTLRARDYKGLDNYGSNGVIIAMRGRNPYNPSDRTTGSPTEQRLEPNSQGLCNTITSVQKDNMVLENIVIGGEQKNQSIKKDGICTTLCSSMGTGGGYVPMIPTTNEISKIDSMYRIRKLTPRECGRLMAVSDENISKILSVVSNSQAYKQFGNSIVVMCMVAMFSNLNIQNKPRWSDIKDEGILLERMSIMRHRLLENSELINQEE